MSEQQMFLLNPPLAAHEGDEGSSPLNPILGRVLLMGAFAERLEQVSSANALWFTGELYEAAS